LSYRSITSFSSSGTSQEILRTTRYLAAAIAPNYQINQYFDVGAYLFYTYGIEKFITRNTIMVSLRPVAKIPMTKNITVRLSPEIYNLTMDDDNGIFLNASFLVSKKNFPISLSGLINKPLKSDIPSEYDFLWNVGLSYAFNKQYVEK
jgi:hypothetical protein